MEEIKRMAKLVLRAGKNYPELRETKSYLEALELATAMLLGESDAPASQLGVMVQKIINGR